MPSDKKKRVAFSVINCICYDQRVQKIAATVEKLGCEVTIIGRQLGDCCEKELVPFKTKRFRMWFKRGFLFYKFFNIRLYFYLMFHNFDILVANDLDTLPANCLAAKQKRVALVFDSHEYFTGVPELNDKPFRRSFWKRLERMIFPRLDHVMTVSNAVAEQYLSEYGMMPSVIRNLAPGSSGIVPYSHRELGIPDKHLLLIMQGGGINIDKGGEELIQAVSMTSDVSLIIAGSGDVLPVLRKMVAELNISGRVIFVDRKSWKELMRYTKSADAGLSLEKDTNLNYRFSLPNKLFDYISAGIPVITGKLPEIRKIIESNDCGLIIPEINPAEICNAIVKLRDDRALLNKLKQNAVTASQTLNWENESKKVTDFYKQILMV